MREKGMVEVLNPSEAFLAERVRNSPGSSVAATLEGTRPLLVEVQGLTSATSFGHPRRTANGVDMNRLYLVIAVLSRRAGFKLSDQDVFVNVVGGMRINEPAADLAIAAAIGSSVRDRPLPSDVVLVGEIGLSGELRSVPRIRARLNEAEKLGFERALVPKSSREEISKSTNIDLIEVRTINEALHVLLDEKP
jgi:DNA repair protein RadA/Sms